MKCIEGKKRHPKKKFTHHISLSALNYIATMWCNPTCTSPTLTRFDIIPSLACIIRSRSIITQLHGWEIFHQQWSICYSLPLLLLPVILEQPLSFLALSARTWRETKKDWVNYDVEMWPHNFCHRIQWFVIVIEVLHIRLVAQPQPWTYNSWIFQFESFELLKPSEPLKLGLRFLLYIVVQVLDTMVSKRKGKWTIDIILVF